MDDTWENDRTFTNAVAHVSEELWKHGSDLLDGRRQAVAEDIVRTLARRFGLTPKDLPRAEGDYATEPEMWRKIYDPPLGSNFSDVAKIMLERAVRDDCNLLFRFSPGVNVRVDVTDSVDDIVRRYQELADAYRG